MILIIITVGMVLYDILYVLPQFLSGVAGYNAYQSGWILALSGLPAFAADAGAAAHPAVGEHEAGGRLAGSSALPRAASSISI